MEKALKRINKNSACIRSLLLVVPVMCITTGCNTSSSTQDYLNIGQSILSSSLGSSTGQQGLTSRDIAAAFKQALNIGTDNVVVQLGQANGFNNDPKIHIPLPSNLAKVQSALNAVGMSYLLDDLELRLNRAAELAMPHAKELFVDVISQMTFDDVMNIYNGSDDSATRYFASKMSVPLSNKMSPFVNNALSEAGAVVAYDEVMAQYKALPFMPDVKANLTSYVVDEGVDGIFYYLAKQEQAIRRDPVRQTTELLRRVFGK